MSYFEIPQRKMLKKMLTKKKSHPANQTIYGHQATLPFEGRNSVAMRFSTPLRYPLRSASPFSVCSRILSYIDTFGASGHLTDWSVTVMQNALKEWIVVLASVVNAATVVVLAIITRRYAQSAHRQAVAANRRGRKDASGPIRILRVGRMGPLVFGMCGHLT